MTSDLSLKQQHLDAEVTTMVKRNIKNILWFSLIIGFILEINFQSQFLLMKGEFGPIFFTLLQFIFIFFISFHKLMEGFD